jgi:hypothetical protein
MAGVCAAADVAATVLADEKSQREFSIPLRPGMHLDLEGTYSIRQGAEEQKGFELVFDVRFDVFVRPANNVSTAAELLVVERLAPRGREIVGSSRGGFGVQFAKLLPASGDRSTATGAPGGEASGSEASGSEASGRELSLEPGGLAMPPLLASYVPLGEALPIRSLPVVAGVTQVKGEVIVFGKPRKNVDLEVTVKNGGTLLDISRQMKLPAEGLKPEGEDKTLRSWNETVTCRGFGGRSWTLATVGRTVTFSIERQGFRYDVTRVLDLKVGGQRVLSPADQASLETAWPQLRSFVGEFGKDGIDTKIWAAKTALQKSLTSPSFSRLVVAIRKRVEEAYRKPSPELVGGADRRVRIGEAAPDFILESLEGDAVSFRELAKGKVTLLAFWGYG